MSGRPLAVLAREALRDALQRRFAAAVALVLALGLLSAHSCTGLDADVRLQGHPVDPAVVAGFLAPVLFSLQALAVLVIAGILASDHLAQPLADGSALAWLARPVSRTAYALARLAGVLGVALGAALVLLGGTGALLVVRHGLAPGPALAGALAAALGAGAVAALAMAASLVVGRPGVLVAVAFGVPLQVLANAVALASALVHPEVALGGPLGALDRFGPPLGTAVFAAVSAWNPHVDAGAAFVPALLRLALWCGGAVCLLIVVFRRRDL